VTESSPETMLGLVLIALALVPVLVVAVWVAVWLT
jgi:hypothetical protein